MLDALCLQAGAPKLKVMPAWKVLACVVVDYSIRNAVLPSHVRLEWRTGKALTHSNLRAL